MTLPAGTRLGPYEILAPLGSGGMGDVYRATDTRLFREVAVKVLPDRFAHDADAAARFEREARAVAALSHPNIVSLFDFGSHAGTAYSVSELLVGETLRERLKAGPLSGRKASEVTSQIAQGLAAAHENGVIHRDLKPENVFLMRDGRVKILDFGLAKLEAAQKAGSMAPTVAGETMPGAVLGTAGYMAPEQMRGEPADHRADIFSLGVVLLEMLTGSCPFARSSLPETFAAILRDDPLETPAGRALSPGLAHVVAHCLEKRPAERFQSARDLGFALQVLEREDSGTSGYASDLTRRTPPARGSVSSGAEFQGRPTGASVAVLPFRNLSPAADAEYFSDGITEEVIGTLSRIPGLRVPARTSCFAFKGRDEDVRRIGEKLGVATVLEGSVRQAGSRLRVTAQLVDVESGFQLWSERWDRELSDVFAIQDELARAIADTLEVRLLGGGSKAIVSPGTEDLEAFNHVMKGRYHFNRRDGREAIHEFEEALARDPDYVDALTGLADAICITGYYGGIRTTEAHAKARAAAERARSLRPDSFAAHVSLGIIEHYFGWSQRRQEDVLNEAIRLAPGAAAPRSWLGLMLAFRGHGAIGLEHARAAARLEPHSANVRTNVAWALAAARRFEEADRELDHALHLDPDAFYPLWASAFVLHWMGRGAEAIPRLERAAALSHRVSFVLGVLGGVYASQGREDDACAILAELDQRALGEYVAPFHRSFVHLGFGDADAAFAELEAGRRDRNALLWWIEHAPAFDSIRGDARFAPLVARIHADAESA